MVTRILSLLFAAQAAVAGMALDGVNDFAWVPDNDAFTFNIGGQDQPFSILMWVRMENNNAQQSLIGKWKLNAYEWNAAFDNASETLYCTMYTPTASGYRGRTSPMAKATYFDRWTHFAWIYSGNEQTTGISVYFDGIRVDSGDFSGGTYAGMSNGSEPVVLGARNKTAIVVPLKGAMADVRIYRVALSQEQIQTIFALRTLRDGVAASSLVAQWDGAYSRVGTLPNGTRINSLTGQHHAAATNGLGVAASPIRIGREVHY